MRQAYVITHVRSTSPPLPRQRRWLVALSARLRASRLDGELAAGVEPWRSPAHTARARQLTGARMRRNLAYALERAVERAEEQPTATMFSPAVPVSRPRVREARPQLLTIAGRLRSGAPVSPRVMAALKVLVTDGAGPVYTRGNPDTLKSRLAEIEEWLRPDRE